MRNHSRFSEWVDERTGLVSFLGRTSEEPVRGGAGLRHVFGSALAGAFLIQLVTGLLLMTSYVPSSSHAWGSVWYIDNQMALGWVIRGLHHFGSSAVVVLLAMHLVQTILLAAYRSPREFNWWLGLVMMFAALGLALTGYLLPWDQKGYWATRVATNIAGTTPVIGPLAQRVLVGGIEYGNQTLTRLYGLHVGVFPMVLVLGLLGHWALARRHGLSGRGRPGKDDTYSPAQAFYNLLAIALVLGILLTIVLVNGGAGLEAPADPSGTDYPARPEWYFLALYQLLNEFDSDTEIIGTMVIPGAIVTLLFLLPVLDRLFPRRLVHFGACAMIFVVLGGAGALMTKALLADRGDAAFVLARLEADRHRERADALAEAAGLPPEGAGYLMARDPLSRGMDLLEANCLSCHAYAGEGRVQVQVAQPTADQLLLVDPARLSGVAADLPDAVLRRVAFAVPKEFDPRSAEREETTPGSTLYRVEGINAQGERVVAETSLGDDHVVVSTHSVQSASDLKGFGTRAWLRGLLEDPSSPRYFGLVPQCGGMASWKESSKLTPGQLDEVADFFDEHVIPATPGLSAAAWELQFAEAEEPPPGYQHFINECADCHLWGLGGADSTGVDSPNVYGWGSPTWIRRMIEEPGARDLYGYLADHEQMPGFEGQLTEADLGVIIRLLRGEYLPADRSSGPSAEGTPAVIEGLEASRAD
ncbi:cytochrome b N-terminal domain-containing protein [Tautonia plasticadhaerens]|uniref:Menaquinol-cytochrome c reductase cytochrome b subunit n=1 Tax=Tautonia plasticadhaerens TaxID=2527974 RepID=A0A518GXP1_9BACT|nr:cytochrome b N-terminal domain-containing protein [Tautonia plasticadhaerens]QDV33368.1 Menaquinol-cytochrome c reductase cytochrome b subunit [Tautonia plasticadhaerens]